MNGVCCYSIHCWAAAVLSFTTRWQVLSPVYIVNERGTTLLYTSYHEWNSKWRKSFSPPLKNDHFKDRLENGLVQVPIKRDKTPITNPANDSLVLWSQLHSWLPLPLPLLQFNAMRSPGSKEIVCIFRDSRAGRASGRERQWGKGGGCSCAA